MADNTNTTQTEQEKLKLIREINELDDNCTKQNVLISALIGQLKQNFDDMQTLLNKRSKLAYELGMLHNKA